MLLYPFQMYVHYLITLIFFPIISLFITHGCTRCMHDETDTAQWSGFFPSRWLLVFFHCILIHASHTVR